MNQSFLLVGYLAALMLGLACVTPSAVCIKQVELGVGARSTFGTGAVAGVGAQIRFTDAGECR